VNKNLRKALGAANREFWWTYEKPELLAKCSESPDIDLAMPSAEMVSVRAQLCSGAKPVIQSSALGTILARKRAGNDLEKGKANVAKVGYIIPRRKLIVKS
jgi:hypothetical protein